MLTDTPSTRTDVAPYARVATVPEDLTRYHFYDRRTVHDIFSPTTDFTPQSGTWGLQGVIPVNETPGDFVIFVTYGAKQGDHTFVEGISEHGLFVWQSQPRETFESARIQRFLTHNEQINSIYLFLRTSAGDLMPRDYTYLGTLAYRNHHPTRQNPVWILWQVLDWDLPDHIATKMGLRLFSDATFFTGLPSSGQ